MATGSSYTERRMRERGITWAEIDEALEFPEATYTSEQSTDREVVLGTTSSGRRLKIVRVKAEPDFIVTVADRDQEE